MNIRMGLRFLLCGLLCGGGSVGLAEDPPPKSPPPVFSFGISDFKETVANCRKDNSLPATREAVASLKESTATTRGIWQFGKEWAVDDTQGNGDTFALKADHTQSQTSEAAVLLPPFDQYDEFLFSEYDLALDLKTQDASGNLIVAIVTETPEKKTATYNIPLKGTQAWQHYSYVTNTPGNMRKFRLILKFQGKGTLWIDNVYLRAVKLGPKDPKIGLEKVMEINDGWKFTLDPENTGKQKGFHQPGFDVSGWKDISILQVWDGQGYKTYNGYAWYRNNNVMAPEWVKGEKLLLYFGGVDEVAVVWVNGTNVGSHIFWELPFVLDVSAAIKPGQRNEIAVKVFDSTYGGGMYGGVTLMRAPKPGEEKCFDVGSAKRLFLDETLVASRTNVEFAMNPAKKAGAVIKADKPWEAQWAGFFTSVLNFSNSLYRMYYTAQAPGEAPRVAVAESKDGVAWTKPELGQVDFQGSRKNNLLAEVKGIGGTAYVNPSAPEKDRYQIAGAVNYIQNANCAKGHSRGDIRFFSSPDGILWRELSPNVMGHCQTDSQVQMLFDDDRQTYLVFLPAFESYPQGPRIILRGEFSWAQSFQWPRSQVSGFFTSPKERKQPFLHCPMKEEFPVCFKADDFDPQGSEFFTAGVVKYPWAAEAFLAFPSLLQKTPTPGLDEDGTLEIQMAASRDSRNWTRFRAPYAARGKEGEPDSAVQIMALGMVRNGDEIYQYYAGGRQTLVSRPYDDFVAEGTWKKDPGEPGIFRLVQRLDGFVSLDAGDKEGFLESKLLRFDGSKLVLNVKSDGEVRVGILGQDKTPIPGFALADCDPIQGDATAMAVTWKGKGDLALLAGRPVRLQFVLRKAKLYAFQFVKKVELK